jgi:hypothetical protein
MNTKLFAALLLIVFLGCFLGCEKENEMPETADIAVIDGEDAGSTPYEFDSLVEEGSNTFTLQAAAAAHGSYGYQLLYDGSNNECSGLRSFIGQTNTYLRFYVKFHSYALPVDLNYSNWNVLCKEGNYVIYISFYWDEPTSIMGYRLYGKNGASYSLLVDKRYNQIFEPEIRYRLEFHVKAANPGGYEFWIDDSAVFSDLTSYDVSSWIPNELVIGSVAGHNPEAGSSVYIDDVLLSTTGPIGEYSEVSGEDDNMMMVTREGMIDKTWFDLIGPRK